MTNSITYQQKLNQALKSKLAIADLLIKLATFMEEMDKSDKEGSSTEAIFAVHKFRKGLDDEAHAALDGLKFFNDTLDNALLEIFTGEKFLE